MVSKKIKEYTQLFLSIFYIFMAVLADVLVLEELEKYQLFYFGIYMTLLYDNLIKGSSVLLSCLSFSVMLLFFSFKHIEKSEDTITACSHVVLCFLKGYLVFTDNQSEILTKDKEKEKWLHIFNEIIPGIFILMKVKKEKFSSATMLNLDNTKKNCIKTDFINKKGKEKYGLKDISSIFDFFRQTFIIQPKNNEKKIMLKPESYFQILKSWLKSYDCFGKEAQEQKNQNVGYNRPMGKKMSIKQSIFSWDEYYYILIILNDENLEDQVETLKEINIKKNNLLASVTHDLRSPLNGILAFIKNAQECSDYDQRYMYLEYARVNGELLLSLINDILDYSSFINDKFRLIKEKFELKKIIDEVLTLVTSQANLKNILIKKQIDFSENVIFHSDARRIKQILINFFTNSIKFTLRGYIKLRVQKTLDENIYKFTIRDTGTGISKENLKKLSQPFSTFDSQEGLNKYGVGLGLNICKKVISLLGPKDFFKITSKEGIGTKVTFFLYNNLDDLDKRSKSDISSLMFDPLLNSPQRRKKNNSFDEKEQINIEMKLAEKSKSFITNLQKEKDEVKEKFSPTPSSSEIIPSKRKGEDNEQTSNYSQNFSSSLNSSNGSETNEESYQVQKIPLIEKNFSLSSPSRYKSFENKIEVKNKPNLNFLLVDDNPFNNLVMSNYLSKSRSINASYECASNGEECVSKFKARNFIKRQNLFEPHKIICNYYDFILLDCIMPIKNGFEAAQDIYQLISTGDYYTPFIIGISGLEENSKLDLVMKLDVMDGFLQKPVTEGELMAKINEFMAGKFSPRTNFNTPTKQTTSLTAKQKSEH